MITRWAVTASGVSDLLFFWLFGIRIRLVTGSSWETVEALMEYKVSDTTWRARRFGSQRELMARIVQSGLPA